MNAPFSMAERYAFAPFIHHLEHWDTEDEHPSFMGGMENDLFGSFLQKNRLDTPLMHSLTELCLTMSPSPLNLRTYEALKHIKQYLMSVTVFPVSPITNTPTAFALCHYGTAEITQSLIRTVAVWGGIAMMKTRAVGFIRSVPDHRNWTKNVMGVNIVMNKDEWAIERARRDGLDISAEDKKQIWVKNVIASRSSFDSIIRQTQIPVPTIQAPKRCIQRAILITNQSLYTISSSQSTLSDITSDTLPVDGLVISVPPSFFAPAQASQPSHPQRRQRGASAAQTAATTTANNILTNPVYMIQAQFDRKVSIFAPAPYYVVQMWCVVDQPDLIHTPSSTLFAPLVNHLFSTQSQPDETKPAVLWSLYFSQKLLDGQLFNYSQESITEQSLELFSSSGEVPDLTSCEEQEHPQIPFHIPQESESPLFLVLPSAAPTLLFDSTPSLSHLLDGLTDPIGSSAILTKLVSSQSFGGLSELSIAQIVDLIVRQKCDVLLEKLRAIPRQDFAVVPFIHPITKEEEEERDRLMEEASARQRLKDEADEAASTQVTSTEEAQPEMLTAVEEDNHDRQTTMPSESLTGEAADEPKE
ncbi:hypothetical protein BLNAU_526 [Blattamonas nauphoetae]|uniref:Uncharacterized protein n=1 Tax=Blattamonas nauphoetae TaxID=2049346 RepID=A0ABQ9YM36_9EUKA|nr:hypothetical protein BLNAU_526 [Blattamonas nauphoetae]